jgi:hypothetical protein
VVRGRHRGDGPRHRAARRGAGDRAAQAHLPRAGAVAAAGDVRRGADGAGHHTGAVGPRGPDHLARAMAALVRGDHGRADAVLRSAADRRGAAGAAGVVGPVHPHPLGHPGARRHPGPRHGGRPRGRPARAVHLGVRVGRGTGRHGRRAGAARRLGQPADGPVGHHQRLRGGGGGRARQPSRCLSRQPADRSVAGIRHRLAAAKHPGAGVRGDGDRAGPAPERAAGPATGPGARRGPCAGPDPRGTAGAGDPGGDRPAGGDRGAAARRPLPAVGADRDADRHAVRGVAAFHDGPRRHGELRRGSPRACCCRCR